MGVLRWRGIVICLCRCVHFEVVGVCVQCVIDRVWIVSMCCWWDCLFFVLVFAYVCVCVLPVDDDCRELV